FVELAQARRRIERLAREEQVRADSSEHKYWSLMQQANDAILVLDGDGRILEANDRAALVLGAPRAVMSGVPLETLVTIGDGGDAREAVRGMLREPGAGLGHVRPRPPEALGRWLEMSATPIGVADQRRVLVIARDVTERREADERIRGWNEELEKKVAAR